VKKTYVCQWCGHREEFEDGGHDRPLRECPRRLEDGKKCSRVMVVENLPPPKGDSH
jgi:hypothetical protein